MAGALTCNDKMCAAYVQQEDGSVCLQVQVKDPSIAGPKIDTEIQLLCDTGNGDAKFYAAVQYTDAGDFEVIEPIDLTGAPYTVVGPVEICAAEDAKTVVTEACDELADGSRVRFYYLHTVQGGAVISSLAIAADGGTYVPNNEIPETKGEFADDIEVTTVQLCDSGNDNEAYLLHTYHNTTTGANTTVTTELDGNTAYTPITEGVYKPTRCFMTEAFIVDKSGLTQGAIEQYWEASATDPGNVPDITSAFTGADGFGLPQHENSPDSTSVIAVAGARTTDNPTSLVAHQNQVEVYICVPAGGAQFYHTAAGLHTSAVFAGACTDQLQLVSLVQNTSASSYIGYYAEGIYRFRIYVHDDGTNGNARLRWKLSTGGIVNIPVDAQTTEMPQIQRLKVIYDKDAQTLTELLTGNDIPLNTTGLTMCDPCGNEIKGGTVDTGAKAQNRIIGREKITVANGTRVNLNPPLDLNGDSQANGAIVQVQMQDAEDRTTPNCVRYLVNGANASAGTGFLAGHKDYIELGCAASNGATVTDDTDEVVDFSLHTGEAVGDVELEVLYYAY